ncbi:right-handed parallel beta-helix repeat-containing protein [Nostoc sp. NIES-2111]
MFVKHSALFLLATLAALAQPEGRRLNIPAVITEPGLYQLPVDSFSTSSGAAIRVLASGVTIDFNGRQLQGPGGISGIGIEVMNAAGVTVRNGNLANFAVHVRVASSSNVTLTDLNVRGQNLAPASGPPETAVMIVQSTAVTVRNLNISNTGLGLFVRGGDSRGNMLVNNSISGGSNGVIGICYNPTETDSRSPRYDTIENNLISGYRTGIQFASSSGPNLTRGNVIFHRGGTAIELNETGSLDQDNVKVRITQ